MSRNYPYRRQPPLAQESQQNHGSYSSANQPVQGDHQICRQPSSQYSTSYPLPPSSKSSVNPSCSAARVDPTLSILSRYGLEPNDLSALAELPEDVVTLDTLPRLLTEIKGKKGTIRPYPPSPSSFSSSAASQPKKGTIKAYPPSPTTSSFSSSAASQATVSSHFSAASGWEDIRNKPVQYPLDHAFITPRPLPPEQVQDWQDRWGNPRQTGSAAAKPPPGPEVLASSSGYVVDYGHKAACSSGGDLGKHNSGGARPTARQENTPRGFTPTGGSGKPYSSSAQPRSTDHRAAPPPERYRATPVGAHGTHNTPYGGGGSGNNEVGKIPCRKAAQDFHGTTPGVFPYACSLCDVTCLSEKVWIQHLNGSQHAVAQLNLLNLFPEWDCRVESCSDDVEPEKSKEKERTAPPLQPNNRQPTKTRGKKSTANGKVVCAKFPAQCVDEAYLRKLSGPFGKIVKVLMFPSLAFVELGSCDQAKDLVKYYTSNPESVNGQEITFNISATFNFLQSSRVVSFIPAPVGDNGFSDLISITKRFGVPIYTLFLPSMAFIEMAITADAQKLVDYYSSNTMKIDGVVIKVAFSGEYNTLMRVSAAKRYEEEPSGTKRRRSPTPPKRREEEEADDRRSSRKKDAAGERGRSRDRARKRSRGSLSSERSSLGRRSHSTEGSSKTEKRESLRRTEKKESSKTESLRRSEKKESSRTESSTSNPTQKIKTEPECKMEISVPSKSLELQINQTSEASQETATEVQAGSSDEDSDIEGMEVIGEDGEDVDDDDDDDDAVMGVLEGEEENALEPGLSSDPRDEVGKTGVNLEKDTPLTQMEQVCASEPQQDLKPVIKEAEKDLPVDMENLITLDELCEECNDEEENNNKGKTKQDKQPFGGKKVPEKSLETEPPPEVKDTSPEMTETPSEETESPPNQHTSPEDKQEIQPGQQREESEGANRDHQTAVETKMEDCSFTNQPQPVEDAVEPAKPTKPVGIEFVRPVVGYFCNLCKVIYADEDEAKTEHCKSLSHYQKYQELTGKDPWES